MALSVSLQVSIDTYKRELEQNPESKVFVFLADAYRKLGRYAEAMKTIQDGLRFHPHYISAKVVLAQIEFEEGSFDSAKSMLEEILRVSRENLMAMKILGQIYYEQNDSKRGVPVLQKVLELDPSDAIALKQLNMLKTDSVEHAPKEQAPRARGRTLADLYKSQGHKQEALTIYKELLKSDPENQDYIREVQELEGGKGEVLLLQQYLKQIQERRRSA